MVFKKGQNNPQTPNLTSLKWGKKGGKEDIEKRQKEPLTRSLYTHTSHPSLAQEPLLFSQLPPRFWKITGMYVMLAG